MLAALHHWIRRRPWLFASGLAVLTTTYVLLAVVVPRFVEVKTLWDTWNRHQETYTRAAHWEEELKIVDVKRRRLLTRIGQDATRRASGRLSEALEALRWAAEEAGVTLEVVRPGQRIATDAYAVRRVAARLAGDFPALVRFLRDVETGHPFINVTAFRCRALEDQPIARAQLIGLAIAPKDNWIAPHERPRPQPLGK